MKVKYKKHYKSEAEGHIYMDREGACTITLKGAVSMPQEELDRYGEVIAKALSKLED